MSQRHIYSQALFRMRVLEEWRRSERSGRRKILVLIHGLKADRERKRVIHLIDSAVRETDVMGWHTAEDTLGVLLVELGGSEVREALDAVREKFRNQIPRQVDGPYSGITVDFHILPPGYKQDGTELRGNVFDLLWNEVHAGERMLNGVKRALDICTSALLLVALSPFFALVALCIRMTSPGPAFFRQSRVGFRGQVFSLYKFRSMTLGCDDLAHREYVSKFISGAAEEHRDGRGHPVYKIVEDQRVTKFGRFLRRTSLDELPQLWNVLRGDMSMVGPRPPLPYEVERYDLWHIRRVYDIKPGVTGVWQVRGRSRCTFDEMTRMDMQHAKPHSLALYFRVLLETPHAVIHGHGAH